MDEHEGMMGEWKPPSPSSKTFFPSFVRRGEQVQMSSGSKHQMTEARNGSDSFVAYQDTGVEDSDVKQEGISFENGAVLSYLPDVKRKRGLGDRIAARAGFNAPRLNTGIIRSNDRSSTDELKSPYLTIPPGISPTALLESPVFLSNSLAQASPTTGKFPFFPDFNMRGSAMAPSGPSKEDFFDDVDGSTFAFKPHPEQCLTFSIGTGNKMGRAMNLQAFPNFDVTVNSENTFQNFMPLQFSQSSNGKDLARAEITNSETISTTAEHSPSLSDQQDDVVDDDGDQRVVDNTVVGSVEDDGYNWRKYGQKQVKGSEFPRSYFKCTHMTCPVKKKVERSHEGHITEIIYTGEHNHPKPAFSRRPSTGFNQFDDANGHDNGGDRSSVWGAAPNGVPREWRNDSLISMNSELLNSSPPLHMQNGVVVGSGDAVNLSSTFSNDEEGDRETHGSASIANDGEGDEQESKRRRIETYAAEIGSGATRAIREPRVVVQTPSDVDILDDGYRWRKYGQKVVKGNPNPRSYYKCTSVGCTVRKHVERASHDLKSVITTYEGKHNHDIPPARNSSHVNTSTSAAFATQPRNLIQHPEPSQVINMARYDRQPHVNSFSMPIMQPFNLPRPMVMNQPSLANFTMAGLGHTQHKLSGMPVHAYLTNQQEQLRKMNEIGSMVPKGDPRVESSSDPNLYLQNGSSVYQQIMNRLPLGP